MMQKKLKNDRNPGKWVLIWENLARAIQWIPTWQGLDGFQKSLHPCVLDESSLSIGILKAMLGKWQRKLAVSATFYKVSLVGYNPTRIGLDANSQLLAPGQKKNPQNSLGVKNDLNCSYRDSEQLVTFLFTSFPSEMSQNVFEINES